MQTEVNVGGRVLTVEGELVAITKTGSLLPGDIVGAQGGEASVVSDSLAVLADEHLAETELHDQQPPRPGLDGRQRLQPVPVTIASDGNRVFSGQMDYQGSTIGSNQEAGPDGRRDTFNLVGDGLALWPLLEGVSLRSLDLGEVEWSQAEAVRSWGQTVEEQNGIFAPVMYGLPALPDSDRTLRRSFDYRYLRYQVYFYPIVKAIFEQVARYSLVSAFFETDTFKRCVHTFGVGGAMDVARPTDGIPPPTVSAELAGGAVELTTGQTIPIQLSLPTAPAPDVGEIDDNRFTVGQGGTYTITVDLTYSGSMRTVIVLRNDSELYVLAADLPLSGTNRIEDSREIELAPGDEIRFTAGTTRTDTRFTALTADFSTPSDFEGGVIRVASCLPDKGVKEFLRGVSHLFNLEWGVDSIRRVVTVEPRFPYVLNGQRQPGYYQINNPRPSPGQVSGRGGMKVNRLDGYQRSFELTFRDDYAGMSAYYHEQRPDADGVALNGARFDDGTTLPPGAKSKSANPYFSAMVTTGALAGNSVRQWPHLWTGGTEAIPTEADEPYDLPEPSFVAEPSCGFIQPRATYLNRPRTGAAQFDAPIMTQMAVAGGTAFALSYADQTDAEGRTVPGLGTVFYPHLAATLLRGRLVNYKARITNPQDVYVENFRRPLALRYTTLTPYVSLLLKIDKYRPGSTANLTALTFVAATPSDRARMKHYRPT